MNLGELKEKLENFSDDLEVYVIADHGQQATQCVSATFEYVESLDYYTEIVHTQDAEGDEQVALIISD